MSLTARNKLFIEEYITNGYNATQAYHKIYPDANMGTCKTKSYQLLKKPEVIEYLAQVQKERTQALGITPEKVLAELNDIAFAVKGDEDYTTQHKLKALELIQKQIGAIAASKVEANVSQQVVIIDDLDKVE